MSNDVRYPFNENMTPMKGRQFDSFVDVGEVLGTTRDIIGALKTPVTVEDQQRKASVWLEMLEDFLRTPSMDGAQFAAKNTGAYPFKSKKTKRRFNNNHIIGKSRASITGHLIQKVNDEISKANREAGGALPLVNERQLLQRLGLSDLEIKEVEAATPKMRLGGLIKLTPKKPTGLNIPTLPAKLPVNGAKVDPAFNVVLPLKPTMQMGLRTKGIQPSNNIEVLTQQFYNEIVRKDQPNNFTNQYAMDEINLFDYSANYADEATDAIITAVIQYVRNLKAKKESGQDLSRVQEIIVTGTERAESKATSIAKKEAATKVGTALLFENKWLWIVGGVVAFIIVIALVLRK